jgi:sugar O-acyltransferase (sialic acid O-acetyltransferase NeuD family)
MLIAGAGGHAIEVLSVLEERSYSRPVVFFDDTGNPREDLVLDVFRRVTSLEEAAAVFAIDAGFIIGVGKPGVRKLLFDKLTGVGGVVQSVISPHARIGSHKVRLAEGLNIMTGAVITTSTDIGKGTLVRIHCSIHHDTVIGEFCELSPGCRILGSVKIGSYVSVGTGAIVLPGVHLGDHSVVGAGAVVRENVLPGVRVAGVPAKKIE